MPFSYTATGGYNYINEALRTGALSLKSSLGCCCETCLWWTNIDADDGRCFIDAFDSDDTQCDLELSIVPASYHCNSWRKELKDD